MAEYFDDGVRPLTCNIKLSQQIPGVGGPIEEPDNYEAELWLNGEPLSVPYFNSLLSLAEPHLPSGGINFDNTRNTWVFHTSEVLTEEEKGCVQRAAGKAGIVGAVDFLQVIPPAAPQIVAPLPKMQGDLDLVTGRQLVRTSGTLRDLVNQDEDEWRQFLSRRAKQEIVAPDVGPSSRFACLYDVEYSGDSRLSELLTIYERVDIMPDRDGLGWFAKHQVSMPDLQELIRLKRIRLILPYSLADYPSTLIEVSTATLCDGGLRPSGHTR